jgi:hypothetical protein
MGVLTNMAACTLSVAGGDLARWLGDLAPRGDLTSPQLLYRVFGLYTSTVGLKVPESLLPEYEGGQASCSTLVQCPWQLLVEAVGKVSSDKH